MALNQECPRKVVKRLSQEEGKKKKKFSQRNKLDKLRKKDLNFLVLKCSTFFGTTIIRK